MLEMQKIRNSGSGPLRNKWRLLIGAVFVMLSSRRCSAGAFWMFISWTISESRQERLRRQSSRVWEMCAVSRENLS